MPTVTRNDTGGVTAAVTRRWRAIDPLLPAPSAPSGGCGAELSVTGPDGQPAAIGFCEHWHEGPGSMELTWGAASRFRLTAHTAGPAVVGLGMATIRFDAHFGTVIERPWSAEALRGGASALLAQPGAWTWLAEDEGHPVAMLHAEPPAAASWIASMTGVSPVAYLELMYVQPDDRGQGAGPTLVGQLHQKADAAGVAVTLLHYEQVNPLSGPFWSRQGYRPLWTSWEARPARTLR